MNNSKQILDELAEQHARRLATARKAEENSSKLETFSDEELLEAFLAICYTEGQHDKDFAVSKRIAELLPDVKLINLVGTVRMPVPLANIIERRLRPKGNMERSGADPQA